MKGSGFEMSDCIGVLLKVAKEMLDNSTKFPLTAIEITVKACKIQRKGLFSRKVKGELEECTVYLDLKLEKAVPKRKKEAECLKELRQKGLIIGSKVRCKECKINKRGCLKKVVSIDNPPFITIDCKRKEVGLDYAIVEPSALRLVISKKKN